MIVDIIADGASFSLVPAYVGASDKMLGPQDTHSGGETSLRR
jgi:hypothetical protein